MIALGFDPGLASAGIAVVDLSITSPRVLWAETVKTKAGDQTEARIRAIWSRLCSVATGQSPAVIGCEGQLQTLLAANRAGYTNAAAALVLRISGLADAAAALIGARLVVVEPQRVKIAVLGPGARSADKRAVKARVQLWCPRGMKLNEHSADAVAVAIAAEREVRIDRRSP